jgi:hypothetical protein
MYSLQFVKTVSNIPKFDIELRALNSKYLYLTLKGDDLQLFFNSSLSQAEVNAISGLVNNFVEIDIVSQLKDYVESSVKPFVNNALYRIQAENIAMGITQAGKTYEVVAFFTSDIVLPGKVRHISLDKALNTNSLTIAIEILDYYIANPSLYSDLSPFITVDRLTEWKNWIVDFLT